MNEAREKEIEEIWAALNKNGDGVVTHDEAMAFLRENLSRDGFSEAEFYEKFEKILNSFLLDMDTNKDGKISKEELGAFVTKWSQVF